MCRGGAGHEYAPRACRLHQHPHRRGSTRKRAPTTSELPVPATDEEAAEAAVMIFTEALGSISKDEAEVEELRPVALEPAFDTWTAEMRMYRERGWTQIGRRRPGHHFSSPPLG